MPLIIDCYNVLHAEKPAVLAGLGEASLCALLAQSRWAAQGVTVVCDGSPKPHSPDPHGIAPVALIYSGPERSADEVIIEMIDTDSAPRRLTVVSSDRAVRRAARRRRARDWTAEGFLNRLASAARGGGTTAPGKPGTGALGDEQVQRWLDWFGIDPAAGPDSPPRPRKRDDAPDDFDADLEAFEREFGN